MEKRLMRLVWNDNNWETPMKRSYDVKKANIQNIAFEKKFGFGGEDWLFNPRYQNEGFQYGYIRGINDLKEDLEFVDEAVLFAIHPYTKDRHMIALIHNLEIIVGYDIVLQQITALFKKHHIKTVRELREVGAYTQEMENDPIMPNVRFKLEDIIHLGYDVIINGIKGNRFNRFKPNIITPEVDKLLSIERCLSAGFIFLPGKGKPRKPHRRIIDIKDIEINNRHTEITEALLKHLTADYILDKKDISVEKTRVNRKIIDLTVRNGNHFLLFEIKTHSEARASIREAIGQLLEYAYSDKDVLIESLNIVSPGVLNTSDKQFLKKLNEVISVPIYYWQFYYNPGRSNKIFQKF
jgi:hypothetical protein